MRLSIIIPSFNQGDLLHAALLSIKAQIFSDYEIIVVDGGSSDNTATVVSGFENNVRFYSEKDKGIYDAMNKGIEYSNGEFIYFMGCDDKLADENVLRYVFSSENIKYDFIYGDVIFSKDGTRYDGEFGQLKLISKNICHQAIFTRRKVFDKIGKFDLQYKYLADWIFNMKCFAKPWIKKKYLSLIIAYYNNDGSSSSFSDEVYLENQIEIRKQHFPRYIRYLNHKRGHLYDLLLPYL